MEQGEFSGRVEHVVSMRTTRFQSLEELATFLRETVLSLEDEEDETARRNGKSTWMLQRRGLRCSETSSAHAPGFQLALE